MDDPELWGGEEIATLDELKEAQRVLGTYPDIIRTPCVRALFPGIPKDLHIYLKLESAQTTGSFKVRGMRYKMHCADMSQLQQRGVVTMSAGNAGRAVSYLGQSVGCSVKVFMPDT